MDIRETEKQKVLSLLQFARKAGKLEKGFDATVRTCKRGSARLVIIAVDLAENSRKRVLKLADQNNVNVYELLSKKEMSELFDRQEIGILSVNDVNFANGLKKYLQTVQ